MQLHFIHATAWVFLRGMGEDGSRNMREAREERLNTERCNAMVSVVEGSVGDLRRRHSVSTIVISCTYVCTCIHVFMLLCFTYIMVRCGAVLLFYDSRMLSYAYVHVFIFICHSDSPRESSTEYLITYSPHRVKV